MKRSILMAGAMFAALAVSAGGASMAQQPAASKAPAKAAPKAASTAAPKSAAAPARAAAGTPAAHMLMGVNCDAPPAYHCPDEMCDSSIITQPGNTVEMKTRRTYFLDCPTGYKPGDKVNVVLSLHGAGSYANWNRMYFPAVDVKDKYKLVIITPGSPTRTWSEADDDYLHNIVDDVVGTVGKKNVEHFILDGHSQGGITATRLVCTPYFRDKVDVKVSLSGGRLGPSTPANRGFGGAGGGDQRPIYQQDPKNPPPAAPARGGGRGPAQGGAPGGAPGGRGGAPAAAAPVGGDCDYSYIFSNGEFESIPGDTSPIADKYHCGKRVRQADVIDPKKGYVWDSSRQDAGSDGWGHYPRSGRAQVYVFPKCNDGRVVADVVKLGKGHTEGYEPNITEKIIALAVSAKGGKIKIGAWDPPAPPPAPTGLGIPGANPGARGPAAPAPARAGAAQPK